MLSDSFDADISLIAFVLGINTRGLLLQQLGVGLTRCLGLYRTGLLPLRFTRVRK
jgi:hypothetical protein